MNLQQVTLGQLIKPAKLCRANDGFYPILSMTMHEGLVEQERKFKKRVASTDTSQYKVVKRKQLVVGFPIDEGVLSFQHLFDEAIVSPAYDIWDIRNNEQVDSRYLERFLRSPHALNFYKSKLRGTTARRRTLPDDIFLSLMIPLPSLTKQQRIADILDRAEALRAKRRAALDQLDELIRSVFIEMFGDPIKNPKKWEEKELKEFGEIITGNTPSREKTEYYGDYIEWIKSDNINTPYTYLTKSEEMLSEIGVKVGRTAPTNSVLVTCIAGSLSCIGNAAIADRNVAFNQQINAIVPNENVNTLFLYRLILNTKRYIQNQSTQSMKGMISKGVFGSIPFIMPPIEAQLKFAEFAEKIEKVRAVQNQSLLELNNLFDSLAHEAFTGKLFSKQFFEQKIENGVKI